LERDECRNGKPALKPYLDTAVPPRLTIGIGRNLTDTGISNATAYQMAHEDIEKAVALLDTYLPWWTRLSEVRQRVLVNMTFNMGMAPHGTVGKRGLWDFQKTLKLIQEGSYAEAAQEMLRSAWAKQVGERANRLSKMMEQGG
jgi:lysozyme